LAPVLLWWAWRHAAPSTRRYTFTVAGSLFVLLCCGYVAFAMLRGELLPGADHVSLIDGIRFQLFSRTPSGFILDRESQAWATAAIWLHYDVFLPAVATVAALALLLSPRRRPIAVAFLLQVVLLLRPGYLPVPYVIAMLPFAALSVAAAVDLGVRHHRHRQGGVRTVVVGAAAIGAALTLGSAVPAWTRGDSALMTRDTDHPMVAAEAWLQQHAGPHDRLLVDDAVWVDLVRSGLPRANVVWYYKADTDPDVMRLTPHGWRDYRYVLVTASMRRSLESEGVAAGGGQYPVLANAVRHSTVVASYGQDQNEVQVRRVVTTTGGRAR
ncbi:MAG TPA: hypothetical protein VN088_00305, partial [Nocardioides sp.]|nr:hypothetical protein [Nocardioides sp.]